jgi:hypothetical protein
MYTDLHSALAGSTQPMLRMHVLMYYHVLWLIAIDPDQTKNHKRVGVTIELTTVARMRVNNSLDALSAAMSSLVCTIFQPR